VTGGAWTRWGKRAADGALVAAAAPLWVPLLAALALLVRATSGGPVLFRQPRAGVHGRPFTILKLRTMDPVHRPPAGSAFEGWTYPGDPRVTPLGRWLRRWRLDELPQLVNVLRGEMSLVGPRPETLEVHDAMLARLPGYEGRLVVRPGLTGMCQVSDAYLRFATDEELLRKLELDLRYVARVSPTTDAAILLRTVAVLARGMGVR